MTGQLPNTSAPSRPKGGRIPGFLVDQEPWANGFFRRMKSYLTERPARLPGNLPPGHVFTSSGFGAGFTENLKEFFGSSKLAARPPQSRLLREAPPWYAAFWANIRDAIVPPKMPPLKLTSKPVAVRDIWSKNDQLRKTQALSLMVHAFFVILIILPVVKNVMPVSEAAAKPQLEAIDISPYISQLPAGADKAGGGGGGGERNPTPASKGKLPKFSMKPQLSRPMVVPRNPNPKLAVEPTLFGPPEIRLPSPNLPNYGDPLAAMMTDSSGPGSGSGIGSGEGGGIGSGRGGGLGPGEGGGLGGGVFRAGRDGVGFPVCVYCPNPTFTDEAVKARFQGTVVVEILVDKDGNVRDVRVQKGLALGLEEQVIKTVKTWRLKPASGPNGQPVAVRVPVEVTFRQF